MGTSREPRHPHRRPAPGVCVLRYVGPGPRSPPSNSFSNGRGPPTSRKALSSPVWTKGLNLRVNGVPVRPLHTRRSRWPRARSTGSGAVVRSCGGSRRRGTLSYETRNYQGSPGWKRSCSRGRDRSVGATAIRRTAHAPLQGRARSLFVTAGGSAPGPPPPAVLTESGGQVPDVIAPSPAYRAHRVRAWSRATTSRSDCSREIGWGDYADRDGVPRFGLGAGIMSPGPG